MKQVTLFLVCLIMVFIITTKLSLLNNAYVSYEEARSIEHALYT
jgi:hypothetical protein